MSTNLGGISPSLSSKSFKSKSSSLKTYKTSTKLSIALNPVGQFINFIYYLATLPDESPPISFSTSATVAKFASPLIVCFKQDAATAKSNAF